MYWKLVCICQKADREGYPEVAEAFKRYVGRSWNMLLKGIVGCEDNKTNLKKHLKMLNVRRKTYRRTRYFGSKK